MPDDVLSLSPGRDELLNRPFKMPDIEDAYEETAFRDNVSDGMAGGMFAQDAAHKGERDSQVAPSFI